MDWMIDGLMTAASGVLAHLIELAAAAIAAAALWGISTLRDRWDWVDALLSGEEVEEWIRRAVRYVQRHAEEYAEELGKEELDAPELVRLAVERVEKNAPKALARAGLSREAVVEWVEDELETLG